MAKNQKTLKNLSELKKAIEVLPTEQRDAAECLFVEISFLHETLKILKQEVNALGAVIKTDDKIKENPALKSYNVSIMRYSQLIKQIIDFFPKTPKEETDKFLSFIENPES